MERSHSCTLAVFADLKWREGVDPLWTDTQRTQFSSKLLERTWWTATIRTGTYFCVGRLKKQRSRVVLIDKDAPDLSDVPGSCGI